MHVWVDVCVFIYVYMDVRLRIGVWKRMEPRFLKYSITLRIHIWCAIEKGERKKLNAGHTLGHALETFMLNKGTPWPHGHCVAAGLVMESSIAVEQGLLEEKEMFQLEELIYTTYGTIPIQKSEVKQIVKLAGQDKKNEGGKVNLSLIGPIGNCHINRFADSNALAEGVAYYL